LDAQVIVEAWQGRILLCGLARNRIEGCNETHECERLPEIERPTSISRQSVFLSLFVHGVSEVYWKERLTLSISMTPAWTNIHISPSPGFCLKSKLLRPGFLDQVALPQGLKVFVNVAWSKDLPPPPTGIKKALELATASPTGDYHAHSDDRDSSSIYVFASDGRLDTDKGALLCVGSWRWSR
jgi:hypothetical protein